MNSKYVLGIDNGGTVAKAALFALDGRELAVASRRTEPLTPESGWVEFDAERLWQATAAAVRQVIADAGIDPRCIAAVACAGHGNGLYLIDDRGLPVRNAIFSSDTRAQSYIDRWISEGVDRAVRPLTMQALWPGQPNALLAWLRDHEPATLQRTRWVLMCKDYIRCRLTGQALAELTDMSGTSLLDVGRECYAPQVLDAFGLGALREKLPPLRQSAEICGEVTAAAADATGLAAGTPVAGGMFDVNACALSSALTDENIVGMTLGTWGINQYVSRTPVVYGVFMTCRYCLPGYYLILEGSAASASNLEWFLRQFAVAELERARSSGESVYAHIDRCVADAALAGNGPLFVPFLYGSPVGADASACLIGMRAGHGQSDLLRAVYEGVVFAHRDHCERLLRQRANPERIRVSGGAARSDVWVQMISDAFQLPVEVPDGSELGALGAAICASVATGCHKDYHAACEAMVRFTRRFQPQAERAAHYSGNYARYRKFLDNMAKDWSEITPCGVG